MTFLDPLGFWSRIDWNAIFAHMWAAGNSPLAGDAMGEIHRLLSPLVKTGPLATMVLGVLHKASHRTH
jgi:hypothetical protein